MVYLPTWLRYAANKLEYSTTLCWVGYNRGLITRKEFSNCIWGIWRHLLHGKVTFCDWNKGEEMTPTLGGNGGPLLVRKIPSPHPTQVFVGDVVLMQNPLKENDFLVRRLAAIEGDEMVSSNEKEEPFTLDKDQCWVLADNKSLKAKEAKDSRLFGPVPMGYIVGRVIYALRSAVDHGPVCNSQTAMAQDSSILAFEVDVEELVKKMKS